MLAPMQAEENDTYEAKIGLCGNLFDLKRSSSNRNEQKKVKLNGEIKKGNTEGKKYRHRTHFSPVMATTEKKLRDRVSRKTSKIKEMEKQRIQKLYFVINRKKELTKLLCAKREVSFSFNTLTNYLFRDYCSGQMVNKIPDNTLYFGKIFFSYLEV